MIKYKTGDLLADDAEALINTVNTVGVMGKGIALAFKQAFPLNFLHYKYACEKKTLVIGQLLCVNDTNRLYGKKLIINFPTKTHWRLPSEYSYIEKGLVALRDFIIANELKSVAMPSLGCGNGGLEWNIVKSMIENELQHLVCEIRVYEPG